MAHPNRIQNGVETLRRYFETGAWVIFALYYIQYPITFLLDYSLDNVVQSRNTKVKTVRGSACRGTPDSVFRSPTANLASFELLPNLPHTPNLQRQQPHLPTTQPPTSFNPPQPVNSSNDSTIYQPPLRNPRHTHNSLNTHKMLTSGLTNTPLTKTLLVYTIASSIALSILDIKYLASIHVSPHFWPYAQFWRAIVWHVAGFTNSTEALFAAMLVYHLRVVERAWGKRKMAVRKQTSEVLLVVVPGFGINSVNRHSSSRRYHTQRSSHRFSYPCWSGHSPSTH